MVDTYAVLFGEQPKEYHAPLEEKDHPKLDTSDLCAEDDIVKYQSLLGAMQWCISLCRMDIALAVICKIDRGDSRACQQVTHDPKPLNSKDTFDYTNELCDDVYT
jgi:hypothetical protein